MTAAERATNLRIAGDVSREATLWDAAELQRDLALASVEEHAPIGWNDQAFGFLESYLREHQTMFTDDLWTAGMPEPPEMRALGGLFQRAVRAGLMKRSGETRPSVRSHLSHKPVWESLICPNRP